MRTFDAALALAAGLAVATLACRGPGTERATLGRDSAGRGATGVVVDTAGPGGMSASGTDATIDSVDAELDTLVRIGPAQWN